MTHEHVDRVEKRHLLAHDGVTMVGESVENGQRVLVISVRPGSGLGPTGFPETVQGLPVFVEEREAPDRIATAPRDVTQHDISSHRSLVRPTEPGTSVGPLNISSAGTLSFLMTDGDKHYISSNEHVFTAGGVSVGKSIMQPASPDLDLSEPGDWIIGAYDDRIVPHDGATVDMAWGEVSMEVDHSNVVHGVGRVEGVRSPSPDDDVVKSGRTTGVTSGTVDQVGVSLEVKSSGVILDDQVITDSDISDPGDSGAPVLHDDGSNDAACVIWGAGNGFSAMCDATNWESASGLSIVTPSTNQNPTAAFNTSVTGMVVDVDGSPSNDPDGNIAGYLWSTGDRLKVGQTVTFGFDEPGVHQITLTVTDNGGATDSATQTVDVAPVNCTYNGIDRDEYGYDGGSPTLFQEWQDCLLTTEEFQSQTPAGDGTAALIPPGGGDGDGLSPVVIAAGIGIVIYLLS